VIQDALLTENLASAQVGSERVCKQKSTVEQRWAAYCDRFGKWRPSNTVELVRGEEVVSGSTASVGDATQPVTIEVTTKSYRWSVKCDSPDGFNEYAITVPDGEAPVDPISVRYDALAKLTIPEPALGGSPPLDDPDRFSVVRVPTWLWITHPWQPQTATASDGAVSVSVTATPTDVTWDPGDGQPPFTCPDAGRPWTKGKPDSAMTCGHTYLRSSAGQPNDAFQLTATVNWSLTWSVNGADQGQFDTYQATLTITHQVGEILSVSS
jgi:hypothetical protein